MKTDLESAIKSLPHAPGIYLFKDVLGHIIYIGKAKDLRNRVIQYLQRAEDELKAGLIVEEATALDFVRTDSELEALVLEARMVQNHQPRFNVLLKTGQPFLYLTITPPQRPYNLPTLAIVRNKKKRGTYFGPFIEKGPARSVFNFLQRTFTLRLCGKKIAGGCLYYHLGQCAGSCREDFDRDGYLARLGLAQMALEKGHKKFLAHLQDEIKKSNTALTFERSRELHRYLQAFEHIFIALDSHGSGAVDMTVKDVWVSSDQGDELIFFQERDGTLKRKESFYFPLQEEGQDLQEQYKDCVLSVYRTRLPAHVIITNLDFSQDRQLFESFLQEWHHLELPSTIVMPTEGHYQHVLRLAQLAQQRDAERRATLGMLLKRLLLLQNAPRSIDCFDISHKQGTFMVGACIRFTDGQPDKAQFRHFNIKSLTEQNDYAALREIVSRRYRDVADLPDLILIDGGKGQLNAVIDLFPQAQFAALAKREETVFSRAIPAGKRLDPASYTGQLLIALRDYTHHFAISFHRQKASLVP